MLFVQAVFFIELIHFAGRDLFDDRLGLAGLPGLIARDFALALQNFWRNVLTAYELRIERRDVHRDVMAKTLKLVRTRHEIRFTVHFQ